MLSRRQALTSLAALAALGSGTLLPRRAGAETRRILIIGDSMIAGGFGLYLQRDLESHDGHSVDRRGKSSTGLARPDFHDWINEGAKARTEAKPDAVVCMFGGNDGQGLYMGKDTWIRWGEDEWTPEYRRRVNRFADAVTAEGELLFWIGMPQMRLERLHERVAHMNEIFRSEMAIRPNARFLDIWQVLADDKGRYADKIEVDGKRVRVRTGDGVHLSVDGCHYLADTIRPMITQTLSARG